MSSASNAQESFFNEADAFFKTNVKDGKVAYSDIKKNPEALNTLVDQLNQIKINKENENEFKAFWINAYNLLTIKGIVDYYPVKSPLDISGFFDKTTYKISGKSLTLNGIENDVLRGNFNDPRFHFVLVCGAVGCPPIIDEAYKPSTLNAQLDQQTKLALNGSFLKVNEKKKRVEASEIMKWYNEDFVRNGQSEIDFINIYRTEKIPTDYKLSFYPYNWTLNNQ